MVRRKLKAQNIYEIKNYLNKDNPLPIYYFYGPDEFAKSAVLKLIEENYSHLVLSEFDKDVISCSKSTTAEQIISVASAFPFGGEKKFIIVKDFNQIKNKKPFLSYVKSPSDFTIMIILDASETLYETELLKELSARKYVFQAAGLKGSDWNSWIISRAREMKLSISGSNAQLLLEIVGENKSLLLRQLEKFADFLGEGKEITADLIKELASKTKGYVIFDLQDAVMSGNKEKALKIGLNLLNGGFTVSEIINSLTNLIYLTALSTELKREKNNLNEEAKTLHLHPYYYGKARNAKFFQQNGKVKLERVFRALLNADLTLKTSGIEDTVIFSILISEIFTEA